MPKELSHAERADLDEARAIWAELHTNLAIYVRQSEMPDFEERERIREHNTVVWLERELYRCAVPKLQELKTALSEQRNAWTLVEAVACAKRHFENFDARNDKTKNWRQSAAHAISQYVFRDVGMNNISHEKFMAVFDSVIELLGDLKAIDTHIDKSSTGRSPRMRACAAIGLASGSTAVAVMQKFKRAPRSQTDVEV